MTGVFAASPALAAYDPTYVLNYDNTGQYVLVRSATYGTLSWKGVAYGKSSGSGAVGINVIDTARTKYQVIKTGAVYWSACGKTYRAQGKVWKNSPYMPLGYTSVKILDTNFAACQ